jgi:hypothetical protein
MASVIYIETHDRENIQHSRSAKENTKVTKSTLQHQPTNKLERQLFVARKHSASANTQPNKRITYQTSSFGLTLNTNNGSTLLLASLLDQEALSLGQLLSCTEKQKTHITQRNRKRTSHRETPPTGEYQEVGERERQRWMG